mmetsp:Transcript_6945/g.12515  ORF Transcript_6945/g.12515 Transcript_6945/m.12515 type:complete len:329 (+) Transcript_6945:121-1107(+)
MIAFRISRPFRGGSVYKKLPMNPSSPLRNTTEKEHQANVAFVPSLISILGSQICTRSPNYTCGVTRLPTIPSVYSGRACNTERYLSTISMTSSAPKFAIDLAALRKEYSSHGLDLHQVPSNPLDLFQVWLEEAAEAKLLEPNAMTLATATKDGMPSARIVLLKGYDHRGFVWYTNYNSRKGQELKENPNACLSFYWGELERTVRIEGVVSKVSDAETEAYFKSRPAKSRLGAWASNQSQPIESRKALDEKWLQLQKEYFDADGNEIKPIERPPHWGGYRLRPKLIEFWKGREGRLHDRISYTRVGEIIDGDDGDEPLEAHWNAVRLQP